MTLQTPAPDAPAATATAGPRPLRRWVAVLLAVLAGAALLLALPPYDLWFLAPAGVALLAAAAHRRRLRGGFAVGVVAGLVLFVPLLEWTRIAAGWLPWMLLSGAQAAFLGLIGLASAWLSPLVDRRRAAWPLLAGLLWVAQEALRDRGPFGGFPWGRLAFSQGDAPALRLAAWGGAPLVTFAVAAAGGALVALTWRRRSTAVSPAAGSSATDSSAGASSAGAPAARASSAGAPAAGASSAGAPAAGASSAGASSAGRGLAAVLPVAGYLVVTGLLIAGPLAVPVAAPGAATATATVAIVQGNVPRLGLDFNAQRRAVLDNHVTATERLADDVAAGRQPRPDLVVWPENSSDIDPLRNADAAQEIASAARAIGVPILVGTVLRSDTPGEIRNAGLLWQPVTGPDMDQLYVKRHPVPFAEYMPLRPIARLVSDKVDLVKNMIGGETPGVVRAGGVTVGDVICFEVAYDGIVRDTVTGGAQVLAVQTNNATFNEAEARQQLAMVRLRAVEHGRDALMVSTVGVSAFVGTAGDVRASTGFNVDATVVREMHLSRTRTLATRLGHWPEMAALALAAIALAAAVPSRRRQRRAAAGLTTSEER